MITTERLHLIPCSALHYEAAIKGDDELSKLLGIRTAINWIQFPEALPYAYESFKADPSTIRWGMYLFVQRHEKILVGTGGYKGTANSDGMVEIGYAISPEYQGRGLATEAAKGLIADAFSHGSVAIVDAHTLAESNASTGVLLKCGLTKIGEKHDPTDGDLWHWRISRGDYVQTRS